MFTLLLIKEVLSQYNFVNILEPRMMLFVNVKMVILVLLRNLKRHFSYIPFAGNGIDSGVSNNYPPRPVILYPCNTCALFNGCESGFQFL